MNIEENHPFLHAIFQLRTSGELVLYSKLLPITLEEKLLVEDFLEGEYNRELFDYPFVPPAFDKNAALWGAKICYIVAQLILYREQKAETIIHLLEGYKEMITASAVLSADLCLRFLPQLREFANKIDPSDILLIEIDRILAEWHYSGIGCENSLPESDFDIIKSNQSLYSLYINRVLERKDKNRAVMPFLKSGISGCMGIYQEHFWKDMEF